MTTIFLLLGASLSVYCLNLTDFSASLGLKLQTFCQSLLPFSKYFSAYAAMVCGVNLPAGFLKTDLQQTGLLHLFVVSGSHLVFLSLILEFVFRKWRARPLVTWSIVCVLIGYALLTGFNPPVVRSLFAMAIRWMNSRFKLFWRPFDETLFSGILCLVIFPFWWASLSFLLSWLASLGLSLGRGELCKALWIYFLVLLPLAGLGLSDPFSILLNWLVAPTLGMTLLPLSLLVVICPPAVFLVDYVWQALFLVLHPLAAWLGPTTPLAAVPMIVSWLVLFFAHFYFSSRSAHLRRKNLAL